MADAPDEAGALLRGGAPAPEDFERFAAGRGAVDLPEVLEAAAVYSVETLGQECFSRPWLLHLAAEVIDDMDREDGLRGFAQLLRNGTIRKLARGSFTLGSAEDGRMGDSAAFGGSKRPG
jgi:hypothetical protein